MYSHSLPRRVPFAWPATFAGIGVSSKLSRAPRRRGPGAAYGVDHRHVGLGHGAASQEALGSGVRERSYGVSTPRCNQLRLCAPHVARLGPKIRLRSRLIGL